MGKGEIVTKRKICTVDKDILERGRRETYSIAFIATSVDKRSRK